MSKSAPFAPISVVSTQAVKSPAKAPIANQGTNGSRSSFQSSRPRCHQKMTSSAPGSVAVTVLLINASRNNPSANQYSEARRVRSKCKYVSAEARQKAPDNVVFCSEIQATDSTHTGCSAK